MVDPSSLRLAVLRRLPFAGAALLVLRLTACSSSSPAAPGNEGGGGAGNAASSGSVHIPSGPSSSSSGGHGPSSSSGGHGPSSSSSGMPPSCGEFGSCLFPVGCDGNDQTLQDYGLCTGDGCETATPTIVKQPCSASSACFKGACLDRSAAPQKACTSAHDCGLPASICATFEDQMLFSDPTCDEGACHWTQIIDNCGAGAVCDGPSGQCTGTFPEETAGPTDPNPMPASEQPPVPTAQACATAADCAQPAPACYETNAVSYANAACVAGSCAWEISITECYTRCTAGACAP